MKTATVSVFIDKYHPQKDKKCSVTIRVTNQRKKKYYPTGICLTELDFERVMTAKRRNETDKETYNKIHAFEDKAIKAVDKLAIFTFDKFEDIYLENREASDTIVYGFDKYIKELKEEERVGTASSYEVARNSLESFRKGLKFVDITNTLLKKYEAWMLENERSYTTIGIYLRSLRAIFNRAKIDRSLYPFGDGRGKYSIPIGSNIKKALNLAEIAKIFHYTPEPNSSEEMAKDYWIFIYLCNGLNVKDLCLLKRKNIDGNTLKFERAKTKRTKKGSPEIVVSLKPEAIAIIKKWGQPSLSPESYVFPHLQNGITAERERELIQQLTKTINKYMKRIAGTLEINKEVTTYFARHSFATVLKRSGASIEFISEALGHSEMKTTKSYLDSFEEEMIHETTNALTAFAK